MSTENTLEKEVREGVLEVLDGLCSKLKSARRNLVLLVGAATFVLAIAVGASGLEPWGWQLWCIIIPAGVTTMSLHLAGQCNAQLREVRATMERLRQDETDV